MREDPLNTVRRLPFLWNLALLASIGFSSEGVSAAPPAMNGASTSRSNPGKPVTIPLTIKLNSRQLEPETELQNIDLTVSEDGEPQTILSIRGVGTTSPTTP